MNKLMIRNALIVNEGKSKRADIFIKNNRIERIDSSISVDYRVDEINAENHITIPGVIDDQVHFREPGLTHKANINTESRAAVLGGTTSFMEMPNTNPPATTIQKLEEKYQIGAETSFANYSFFMGTSNDNLEEIKRVNPKTVCGVKIFMGSSTGDMLVDNEATLRGVFAHSPTLIATHCEVESIILANKEIYKDKTDPRFHPVIRSREACTRSSLKAIELAKEYNSRLHILHISTAEEVQLFDNKTPLRDKKITSEACVHHLWFSDDDYDMFGNQIVCNPAIKSKADRDAVWNGLLSNNIDIIATDHAPHTWAEKSGIYPNVPSGVPLVQHSLLMMLEKVREGVISIERMVEKMAHAPADCFRIEDRGFIREGYFADIVLVNPNNATMVSKDNIAYKCGWSPFEGHSFSHSIDYTFVSGILMQKEGKIVEPPQGLRMSFNR
jgi:dihydroorotase